VPSLSAIAEILTVGHSTQTAPAFADLLRGASVETVADVRRFPSSRRMPWFNEGSLRGDLAGAGIEYLHLPELGGRRSPLAGSPNAGWRVGQFQGYADHMESDEFAAGLSRLLELAARRRTAVMCAEAQWWRCHRRLVSDALVARGWTVTHLGSRGETEPHRLTEFAVVEGERVVYPPAQASMDL
jgi:uncharacterized protein (DUF488 family)